MSIKPLYEFDAERRQRIVKMHLEMPRRGAVTGPIEGAYGEIYSILLNDSSGTRVAAKSPRIKRFGSPEKARIGVEQVLHELEKTHRIFMVPWINKFFDVQIIHGWPFILSRYRDGSLEDLIANPLAWSLGDRIASLIQIVRALRLAQDRGIAAHQDLKPGNVFFDDLSRKGVPKESKGMHFHMFVADFGLADAFRDFAPVRNSGSRPYMAPEQFSSAPIDTAMPIAFDAFALGVIAFEVFTDGKHPIGVTTAEVWGPGRRGKWADEAPWRAWAATSDKSEQIKAGRLPAGIGDFVLASLSVDPDARPSFLNFEDSLWDALRFLDSETHAGLRMQIDHIEGLASDDNEWPHMDERVMQLRAFYSAF